MSRLPIARGRRLGEHNRVLLYRKFADGERALAAGMLLAGIDAAEAADGEAARWLRECAAGYLGLFTDEGDALADELARMVGEVDDKTFTNVNIPGKIPSSDVEVRHEQNDETTPAGVPVMIEYQQAQLVLWTE